MDDFREWLSDNLRYILLGLAIIVVLVIAFFAVRLISDRLGDDGGEEPIATETASVPQPVSEDTTQTETATEAANPLRTDNQAILDTVTQYYNAVAAKNFDALEQLGEIVDESSREKITANPIESYNNIAIYFKNGLGEGAYNVYPYYEAKLPNIDQLIPSLGNLYLDTREDGSLYVVNPNSNQQVADFLKEAQTETDVQELIARINNDYNTVLASNEDLQAMIQEMKKPETEVDIPDAGSVDASVSTSVTVTGNLNVRADSRQDSEQVGALIPGQTVTRLEALDNGWSRIRFDDGAGTVLEGYVLSEYLQENAGSTGGE